jgi:hypothetical protein
MEYLSLRCRAVSPSDAAVAREAIYDDYAWTHPRAYTQGTFVEVVDMFSQDDVHQMSDALFSLPSVPCPTLLSIAK